MAEPTVIVRCTDPGCGARIEMPSGPAFIPPTAAFDGWQFGARGFEKPRWRCPECISCDEARAAMIKDTKAGPITWDAAKRDRLRARYALAVKDNEEAFKFDDYDFLTAYAKYLLEFLDERLGVKTKTGHR